MSSELDNQIPALLYKMMIEIYKVWAKNEMCCCDTLISDISRTPGDFIKIVEQSNITQLFA
jgi:hypothetical protein